MPNKPMRSTWKIKDLLDLEYFFQKDRGAPETALDQRDRELFIRKISVPENGPSETAAGRNRRLIRHWLDIRRAMEKEENPDLLLPGQAYADVYRIMKIVALVLGSLTGMGLSAVFLKYSGTQPINVFHFIGALVLPQMALAMILVFVLVMGAMHPAITISPLYSWMGRMLARGMARMIQRIKEEMAADQKQGAEHLLNLVKLKNKIYGKIFYWPVFMLVQVFGAAVNLGILAGTLTRVLGTDLAFGWQTTLSAGPAAVFKMIRILALPWAWAVPGDLAHPTLQQIEGSRIILKEGIHTLATQDLVSWWPFLCFCVFFYGLIPRVLFLTLGAVCRNWQLTRLGFSHGDCWKLVTRMTTPRVEASEAADRKQTDGASGEELLREWSGPSSPQPAFPPQGGKAPWLVLIPEDIFPYCDTAALVRHFGKILAPDAMVCQKIALDPEPDRPILRMLSAPPGAGTPEVFLLLEAWQPPIKEILNYIKTVRQHMEAPGMIIVGLLGKPKGTNIFTPVDDGDLAVWRHKISSLNDPYLVVERGISHGR